MGVDSGRADADTAHVEGELEVRVRDETTAGGGRHPAHELLLRLESERLTVRELIRSRVWQEVSEYNARTDGVFRGLVQPTEAERELNGYRLPRGRRIDFDAQFAAALEAFERNRVLLLVDDRQFESLDEEVELRAASEVTFLRLVPLAGG
jgi:hypothetical protein